MKIRTGIFGGSFNPIHNGHLELARKIVDSNMVDELWFLISPQNPLKDSKGMAGEDLRLFMARKATEKDERISASDFEFSLPRPSYTSTTLQRLRDSYPQREFVLVIGQDNWEIFDRWHDYKEILASTDIIVYPRGDSEPEIDNTDYPRVHIIDAPLLDVSSTQIRNLVSESKDFGHLVPPSVKEIITRKKLYK